MAQANVSRNARSSFITKAEIKSNKDPSKVVSLLGGTQAPGPRLARLMYYESILQDTVKAEVIFDDTGGAIDNKSTIEGLPLVGTEEVNLAFTDNNDNTIKTKLYVNKVTPAYEDTRKSRVMISLVSEEFLKNEQVRLNVRFDGKISDHVKRILTDKKFLSTKKKLDIEETSNNYNFIGNNRKPYYALNWLSKASVPGKDGKKGDSAGFFFFETSDGFKFKSIDGLFAQEKKKSLIYNESTDKDGKVPAGYDGKVLEQQSDNAVNAQEKFQMGAYGTRLVCFDPFNCYYEVIKQTADESKKGTNLAAKDLPKFNDKFKSDFTRTTYMLIDRGTLPSGSTQQQIDKSTEQNFEAQKVLNQAIRRYNQMFAGMQTITIAGDFSLHAGDVIFLDTPGLRPEKSNEVNKEYGGLYIIADLCHYISQTQTFTKLNLVRDSFGRKGNHTSKTPL